jgi:hypothetical protein
MFVSLSLKPQQVKTEQINRHFPGLHEMAVPLRSKLLFPGNPFPGRYRLQLLPLMKKISFSILALFAAILSFAQTNPGDRIVVQTFTFGSPQNAWFVFPSDTMRYEKIMMKYTLKCNPAQNPACGEWDYLTNTYVYDHTGLLDSSRIVQPTCMIENTNHVQSPIAYYHTLYL